MAAPEKRIGFFLEDATAACLTASGWKLFDAAVNWAYNDDSNNWALYQPTTNNGGTITDVTGTAPGPIAGTKTWKFTKTGNGNQWHGWDYCGPVQSGDDCNQWIISGYYKISNSAGITQLNIDTANFNCVESKLDLCADGKWHYFYAVINSGYVNGYTVPAKFGGLSWGYSTLAGELYINGLRLTKAYADKFCNYVFDSPGIYGGNQWYSFMNGENVPVQSAPNFHLIRDGLTNEWQGWRGDYNGIFTCNVGEYWTISGYYNTTNPAGQTNLKVGNFYKSDWQTLYNYTVINSKTDIIADGEWHYFYFTIRANETMSSVFMPEVPAWDYSSFPGVLYINGLRWNISTSWDDVVRSRFEGR